MSWPTLTSREQDKALHQKLFPRHNIEGERYCDGEHERHMGCVWLSLPLYTISLDAVGTVESEIGLRGLQHKYIYLLGVVLGVSGAVYQGPDPEDIWTLLRATPAQRAEAAYRVLSGEG